MKASPSLKKFIKEMISNRDDISSKRISGIVCLMVGVLLVFIVVMFQIKIEELHYKLIVALLVSGLALLGVASVEKIWKA